MQFKIQNKNNWLLFIVMIINGGIYSQSIEKLYVQMPDILNPTLSSQNRLELLEYHKAHQSDSTTNRFGNMAYLMLMDTVNQRVIVKNTESSTFEMKLNRLADSTLCIGIIRTACAPVCQSTIEFYDTAWNVIPLRFVPPKASEWLIEKKTNTEQIDDNWLHKSLDISFVSMTFSNENNIIMLKNNTLDFLSVADQKILKPLISDKIFRYKLKNSSWLPE